MAHTIEATAADGLLLGDSSSAGGGRIEAACADGLRVADSSRPTTPTILFQGPAPLAFFVIDFNLRDRDPPGVYVCASPVDPDAQWHGAVAFWSEDDTTYHALTVLRRPSLMGHTVDTLGTAGGAAYGAKDTTNDVQVVIWRSSLVNRTTDEVRSGLNNFLIGEEIVGAETVTLDATDGERRTYTLSNLWRGRRGTSLSGHAANEYVVLLDERVKFVPVEIRDGGETRYFKVLATGQALADVAAEQIDFTNVAWRPQGLHDAYAPGVIQARQSAPPSTVVEGDRYLVLPTGTGAFASHDNEIAAFYDKWVFYDPPAGTIVHLASGLQLERTGSDWSSIRHGTAEGNITASGTQSQGQSPLTAELNHVTTCAIENDVVTLPGVEAGATLIIANDGAQTLQIYPASGEKIDGGSIDASITLAAGARIIVFSVGADEWLTR